MVGSPAHPVMPNLIVLWKVSPPWGEGRAGARLCPLGSTCPLAPPFGTQTGPLPAGLAGGASARRPRRFPLALNPRSSLVTQLTLTTALEGKQRRIMVMSTPSGSQQKYNDRLSVPKRKVLAAREGKLFPVTCT
jgi:hypothetical protein